jgi:hypothetical protein
MRNFRLLFVLAGVSVLCAVAVVSWKGKAAGAQTNGSDPSFETSPPLVQSMTIQALDTTAVTGNANLSITYQSDARLTPTLPLQINGQTVTFNQVAVPVPVPVPTNPSSAGASANTATAPGPTYSAKIDFDFNAFQAEQSMRAALAQQGVQTTNFNVREVVGTSSLQFVDPATVQNGAALSISPAHVSGIAPLVDPARELMITDLSVVNDPGRTWDPCTGGTPMGVWTFGFLISQMANQPVTGIDPADFAEKWVDNWLGAQVVNTFNVPSRVAMAGFLAATWPRLPSGKLDISRAPFRLMAIVNRIDLRKSTVYGGGNNAGEARFVFNWVDPHTCSAALPFNVILEYGVQKKGCPGLHAWAQQWANLGTIPLGTAAFNNALQAITDQFSLAGEGPGKPNQSTLDQLRSNEIELAFPWELREFHITPTAPPNPNTGQLLEATVAQTPDLSRNNTTLLTNYINANLLPILGGTYTVPLTFAGQPFLGGNSPNPPAVWSGSPLVANNTARFDFSLGTCSGCHQGETQFVPPFQFVQLSPRTAAMPTHLSTFLTGETVHDPIVPSQTHTMNDLLRREQDLDALLRSSCTTGGIFRDIFFVPLNSPH